MCDIGDLWDNTSSILLIVLVCPFIEFSNKLLGHFLLVRANNSFPDKS